MWNNLVKEETHFIFYICTVIIIVITILITIILVNIVIYIYLYIGIVTSDIAFYNLLANIPTDWLQLLSHFAAASMTSAKYHFSLV